MRYMWWILSEARVCCRFEWRTLETRQTRMFIEFFMKCNLSHWCTRYVCDRRQCIAITRVYCRLACG
jgi:hypothetical protein